MVLADLYPDDRIRHIPFLYYPNVNNETDAITPERARSFAVALASQPAAGRKAILYLHVPFCRNHCTFCFYNIEVVKRADPIVRTYTDAVRREMERLARSAYVRGLSIEHVFIGGGTPSMLPDDQLREVLEGLRRCFDLSAVRDFTIEMHLETMSRSNLELCRELGVNRVSFGWQTSAPRLRKLLALLPSEETLLEAAAHLAELGFPLVWDLMFALPGQSDDDWERDLARSIELGVACVDLHRCDIVPPAPLYELVRSGKAALPEPQRALEQYRHAVRMLVGRGFAFNTFGQFNRPEVPRAISHYGRYQYRSSHDLVALGPGAIGTLAGHAYMNARDLGEYAGRASEAGPAAACVVRLSDATWQERDFVLGLGQLWSVPKALLRGPLSARQQAALERLTAHDAIVETPEEYRLSEAAVGYHFSIANEFVADSERARNLAYLRAIGVEVGARRRAHREPRAHGAI